MIDTLELLTYDPVPGLDPEMRPGIWGGKMTFDWSDVKYTSTYKPDEKTLEKGITEEECSRIYFNYEVDQGFTIRIAYTKAQERFINSRKLRLQ